MKVFENWCALRGVQPLPAAPADVASFVTDCAAMGMTELWPAIQDISRAHYTIGLADPTLGGFVARAINTVSKIEPPRSWTKTAKEAFGQLPYSLQVYVLEREKQRDREVRRGQNEVAAAKQRLAELLHTSPVNDLLERREREHGTKSHTPA